MSVWDTYGMKTEIILAKSWIQTPKEGYGNRFDEFLTFFWKGVGYIILCFFGAVGFWYKKYIFFYNFCTKWVAVRPHGLIFNMEGSIFRARSDPSVNKNAQTSFLTKNDFFKNQIFCQFSLFFIAKNSRSTTHGGY